MSKQFLQHTSILQDKIFRFCLRLLGNYEDSQDVVQDVMEKLWKQKDSLEQYNNLEAFSIKAAKNICLNKVKHEKMKAKKLEATGYEETTDRQNDYDNKEMSEIIKQLIKHLPEKQKMAIHLRDVEGMSFEEISEALELEVTSVRMNLSRARKTIKEQLISIENYGI